MISINCSEINDLKPNLAAYLSEKFNAVPLMRTNDIVLDPLTQESEIRVNDVFTCIKKFLEHENIHDFLVTVDGNKIQVIVGSKHKTQITMPDSGLLACPHCGLVTPYEEEMDVHIRIHYVF